MCPALCELCRLFSLIISSGSFSETWVFSARVCAAQCLAGGLSGLPEALSPLVFCPADSTALAFQTSSSMPLTQRVCGALSRSPPCAAAWKHSRCGELEHSFVSLF